MAYKVVWDNDEKTVLRQIFHDHVTISDYYQANDEAIACMKSQAHKVDLIIDLRDAKIDMTGFLTAIRSVDNKIPANQRHVIVVQANLFIQTMKNIASKFAKRATESVYFVDTLEEAYALIQEYERDLSQSSED